MVQHSVCIRETGVRFSYPPYASLAQLAVLLICNEKVAGSNPARGSTFTMNNKTAENSRNSAAITLCIPRNELDEMLSLREYMKERYKTGSLLTFLDKTIKTHQQDKAKAKRYAMFAIAYTSAFWLTVFCLFTWLTN